MSESVIPQKPFPNLSEDPTERTCGPCFSSLSLSVVGNGRNRQGRGGVF